MTSRCLLWEDRGGEGAFPQQAGPQPLWWQPCGLRKQQKLRKEAAMMPMERMAHSRKIAMGLGGLEGFFVYKTLGF